MSAHRPSGGGGCERDRVRDGVNGRKGVGGSGTGESPSGSEGLAPTGR